MKNKRVAEERAKSYESWQSTSPGNLYAEIKVTLKFWEEHFWAGAGLCGKARSEPLEFRAELGGALVVDAVEAEGAGGVDVGFDVIDENRRLRLGSERLQGVAENERRGFASADDARVGAGRFRKESEKIEARFEMRDVNRIGVGQEADAKILAERFEQGIVLNWLRIECAVPSFGKLFER